MKDQHIARLEAKLEKLVENTCTHIFGKTVRSQEIALQIARAMEDFATKDPTNESRPIAPDRYAIHLHPTSHDQLLKNQPGLSQDLSDFLVQLANNAGYRLVSKPRIELMADEGVEVGKVRVLAAHSRKRNSTTAVMQRVELNDDQSAPQNAQLLLQGKHAVTLREDVINIGRSRDNHIVIDDNAVSRYHLQLRLRFGRYTLFDAQSESGTFVNEVQLTEHVLRSGDVIRIGNTALVYMEDIQPNDGSTQTSEPVNSGLQT